MTAPVFLVAPGALDGSPDTVTLDGAEGRHAVSVRRLRTGEEVVLTDGAGRGAEGVVVGRDGQGRPDRRGARRPVRARARGRASPSCRRCPRATAANWPSRP